jgi:proline iminopeptidase
MKAAPIAAPASGRTLATPHSAALRAWIGDHQTTTFFAATYAVSWLLWLGPALGIRGVAGALLLYGGVFGPAVVAATLTCLTGGSLRTWMRGLVRFRAPSRWYAAVLGAPIVIVAATVALFVLTDGKIETSLLGERLAAYLPILVIWTLAGAGEEPGWRGFALPRLQERLAPLRATVLLGVLWALWHLPLLAAADEPSHGLDPLPLVGVTLMTIGAIVAYAVFYTYLWNRTRSIWLAILFHGSLTAAIGAFVLVPTEDQVGSTYAHLQAATLAVLIAAATLLVMATQGRLGRDDPRASSPRPHERRQMIHPRTHSAGSRPHGSSLDAIATTVGHWLGAVWRDRRLGAAATVGVGAATAAVLASVMPRGPMTAPEGLATMVAGLGVGIVGGLTMRSRWAMLLAPLAFVAGYELVRLGTDGPTVDGVSTSTYGLIALAVGRGVHGLLVLTPMLLGAASGAGIARRLRGVEKPRGLRRGLLYARRGVTVVVAAALVALAVAVLRPGTTDPIVGANGEPLPGSVAELTHIDTNGHDLALMIRGRDRDNPVLLFLAGGPGGSELGAMRRHLESLEEDFIVATWDQRGAGKSYDQLDPTSTLTLDGAVSDTISVTNYLRERFGGRKVYLVGQSYGSILGVLAVKEQPELYSAFVGIGQMVSTDETDRIFYRDTLAWARANGESDLVKTLTDNGPPPYDTILKYEPALSYEHEVYPYDHTPNHEGEGGFSENIFVEEYTLLERLHNLGAFMDTFSVLYPQLAGLDFRTDATALDVPVYLVQGRHEAAGRAVLADEWFDQLEAPRKEMVVLETSGHRPLFEQPREFHQVMVKTVLGENAER